MLHLEQLNEAQRKAVMHGEGPLLVLAGPGSGKTFTITQRIHYLVQEKKVPPEEILVITFTREAALSMQQRFLSRSDTFYPVIFGTFHSVFYHILNQSDTSHHRKIMREAQKKSLLYSILKNDIGKRSKEIAEEVSMDISMLLSCISFYKNTGDMDKTLHKLPVEWKPLFPELLSVYEQKKSENHFIDFDDMVYECALLLERNMHVRTYWQNRFSHILMDEFQDINPMQYRVVRLLTKEPFNLFAVGDDDQAIYGFRGANPNCLKQFVKDYHAKQILLNLNYRSNSDIVRAASLVIAENKNRFPKAIVAKDDLSEGTKQNQRVSIRTFRDSEKQFEYLTQMLSKSDENDMNAILFRTNLAMQSFATRLKQAGIAFSMKEKMVSIYEQPIIKDIMAYLRLACGERKKELWLRILNKPSRYIGREALAGEREEITLEEIRKYYDRLKPDNSAFAYVDKIKRSLTILEKQLQYLKTASPFLAVQYVQRVIGYETAVKQYKNSQELLVWIREDAKLYHSLSEWLEAQNRYEEMIVGKQQEEAKTYHSLYLMTAHASKGLEFDRVWIPDCNEKNFPHGNMPEVEACEEERRIFYVAMTRAKKNLELLALTGTKERPRFLSRFLNPLWKDYSSSSTTSSNSH